MNIKKYLILPGCDDTNRGDQALIWETLEIAKASGFEGEYYMIAEKEQGKQSKEIGINSCTSLLPHPASHVKSGDDNRHYSLFLVIRWTLWSIIDLLVAYPLSKRPTRWIAKWFLKKEQKETFEIFTKVEAAFVKGGGFLHSYSGIIDSYKIYYFLYHINLALSMGIPVYVMPNSYGPFNDKLSRKLVNSCLKKCRVVYSRESISKKVLFNSCHVNSKLSIDLAMYLKTDSLFNCEESLAKKGISLISGKIVGITVRPYRFPESEKASELYEQYKRAIEDMIIWLKQKNYFPILIEHVFSETYHEQDLICITEIMESLKSKGIEVSLFSDRNLNCRQMKKIYSCMNYLIGTRFHSVIFSLTEHVPVIVITYGGNKGEGIMKDLGLSRYSISISEVTFEKLRNLFLDMVNNKADYNRKLLELKRNIKVEYEDICKELSRLKGDSHE